MAHRIEQRRFELCVDASQGRVIRGRIERPANALESLPHVIVVHGFKGFMDWGFFPELAARVCPSAGILRPCSFNMSPAAASDENPVELSDDRRASRATA